MSTYPVDIKTANITTADTHTVFNGPARVLGDSAGTTYKCGSQEQ
jgi:hypothetical protein